MIFCPQTDKEKTEKMSLASIVKDTESLSGHDSVPRQTDQPINKMKSVYSIFNFVKAGCIMMTWFSDTYMSLDFGKLTNMTINHTWHFQIHSLKRHVFILIQISQQSNPKGPLQLKPNLHNTRHRSVSLSAHDLSPKNCQNLNLFLIFI